MDLQWLETAGAQSAALDPLTEAHWRAIDFIDKDFKEKGVVPGMGRMNKVGGIPTKDLYALFPNGPIKKAARISGYPKPACCV